MTVISVIKKDGVLVPADSNASGVLDRVKEGREILITARAPRSAKQHRFFWHLCRLISENSEKFDTPENVSDTIKIGTGHYEIRVLNVPEVGQIEMYTPKSIAFESLPRLAFQQFMEKALDYVSKHMLPGVPVDTIRREIEAKMSGP